MKATKSTRRPIRYPIDDRLNANRTNGRANSNLYTLGVVCTIALLFPPLGAALAINKLTKEKSHYYDNGAELQLRSLLFFVFAAFPCIFVFFAPDSTSVFIFCYLGGLWLLLGIGSLVGGAVLKRKGLKNERYMAAITLDRITQIDTIAAQTGDTYADAVKTIQALIDAQLLQNAYIHHPEREVIVPGISKKIALRCRQCSGTTVLHMNEPRKCAYCGAML